MYLGGDVFELILFEVCWVSWTYKCGKLSAIISLLLFPELHSLSTPLRTLKTWIFDILLLSHRAPEILSNFQFFSLHCSDWIISTDLSLSSLFPLSSLFHYWAHPVIFKFWLLYFPVLYFPFGSSSNLLFFIETFYFFIHFKSVHTHFLK